MISIGPTTSALQLELAQDIRRSVLCGELHLSRDAVADGLDSGAWVALAMDGAKPVGTVRLTQREEQWLIELLAVLPTHRGQGVGSLLVSAAVEQARVRGALSLLAVAPLVLAAFLARQKFSLQAQEPELAVFMRSLSH